MPLALDPNATFPLWLDSDEAKKPRPEFHFKALTITERREVYALPESFKANESITVEEIENQSSELFLRLCKSWSNMGAHQYGAAGVADLLTHEELWQLLYKAAENSHVSHDEKKSSES